MHMHRYPVGTPYQGPHVSYDRMVTPEQLVARVVYGTPPPMLKPHQRLDMEFFGRLLDQMANSHVALVKTYTTRSGAAQFAAKLRKELAELDRFSVGVKQHPEVPSDTEWFVLVYNNILFQASAPPWWDGMLYPTREWVDTKEAARILRVQRPSMIKLIKQHNIQTRRVGAGNRHLIPREALPILANRKGRHRRKRIYRKVDIARDTC